VREFWDKEANISSHRLMTEIGAVGVTTVHCAVGKVRTAYGNHYVAHVDDHRWGFELWDGNVCGIIELPCHYVTKAFSHDICVPAFFAVLKLTGGAATVPGADENCSFQEYLLLLKRNAMNMHLTFGEIQDAVVYALVWVLLEGAISATDMLGALLHPERPDQSMLSLNAVAAQLLAAIVYTNVLSRRSGGKIIRTNYHNRVVFERDSLAGDASDPDEFDSETERRQKRKLVVEDKQGEKQEVREFDVDVPDDGEAPKRKKYRRRAKEEPKQASE